jgi:hypothetical protein
MYVGPQNSQPYLDTNEFEGSRSGGQPDQGSAKAGTLDYDIFGDKIYVGDDEDEGIVVEAEEPEPKAQSAFSQNKYVQITEITKSKDLKGTIQRVSEMGIDVSDINLKDKVGVIKDQLKNKVRQFVLKKR